MNILFVSGLGDIATARHRFNALVRLGHHVEGIDTDPYFRRPNRYVNWWYSRTYFGPAINKFNREVTAAIMNKKFDLVWFDKTVYVRKRTLEVLSASGVKTIHYNIDNPFGPRGDPGWGNFLKVIPDYDIHVVPRRKSIADYIEAGARKVVYMPLAYEPTVHYPPPEGWSDKDRPIDVAFTGSPYDDRADVIRELWERHDIRVSVRGARWDKVFSKSEMERYFDGPAVYNDAYRERICRSKINLGFVTRSNEEMNAHRWFEIAACGAFLLAERTAEANENFLEDREAVYFTGVDECAKKIKQYLANEQARAAVAQAGYVRAMRSGYSNGARLERALEEALNSRNE